jgi:hypothetical protein
MSTTITWQGDDGVSRLFPVYESAPLSWDLAAYFTAAEERIGYPRMRAVVRAMLEHRPEQLQTERRSLRLHQDRLFGHNARKMLAVIDAEINDRLRED